MTRHVPLIGLLAALASGCGGPSPVEGIVTLDGSPVAKASIVFLPQGPGKQAHGMTDEEGRFRLDTGNKTGALTGKYRVILTKRVFRNGATASGNLIPVKGDDEDEGQSYIPTQRGGYSDMIETIPEVYTKPQTTTLEIDIPKGGKNDIELKLSSKSN